ncbi:MAG: PPC domain-containing protein [Scytolyngbya sp. HA4215-MV1]|jgi:hypothetical protein|nr:PPC domain-containing protein [Scytolyngbya sp. HA4215-MV1]
MTWSLSAKLRFILLVPATLLITGLRGEAAIAQSRLYNPIPLNPGKQVLDSLSEKDIPTGQGGFARDYVLTLKEGDQVAVDLSSENFDTVVTLMAADGTTIAENDDGPDGSTNSLLFIRIVKPGSYIVRVRAFGETAGGNFKLKLSRLKPI